MWISSLEPMLVERRFGAHAIDQALAGSRAYVEPPELDASARLSAVIMDTPGGKRLSSPFRVSVRMHDADTLDVTCECSPGGLRREARICDHVVWLLVDVAFHHALREAIVARDVDESVLAALPAIRVRALEQRTLDERIAAWLPARTTFDDDFEIDIDVVTTTNTAVPGEGARSALLLFHRRTPSRALVSARDVLASRLVPRHRRLVDLTSPHHLDRNALIAIRGQASLLIHLLRQEIGLHTEAFKARARFSRDVIVRPRVERDGERLVVRWYGPGTGEAIGDAESTFVFAGPFPYLWVPASRTFYEIAPEVDLEAAMGMQRVPSLPIHDDNPEATQRMGRALLLRGRGLGVALPPPETFGLPPLEAPSFELRLTGTPLDVRGELLAVYGVGKMPIKMLDEAELMAGRDLDAEEKGVALLHAAGMAWDEAGKNLQASEDRAVQLWESGLADLHASGEPRFDVLIAESLARTKVGPRVEVDVRVGATAGWLDTELEFRAGALRVEIDRLHQALAAGKRWVTLSDGSLAKISESVAALVGEASLLQIERKLLKDGKARLPPHQFGRIARWIELADAADGVKIDLDDNAQALRTRLRDLVVHPEVHLPAQLEGKGTLRPYQRVGLAWLQLLKVLGAGGVLADDMGLGKTLMTLAFLARWYEDSGSAAIESSPTPSLVVCPTSVVGNWAREAARFTPSLRVLVWTGADRSTAAIANHDLVVTTYGVLRRDAQQRLAGIRFRCIVLDEAQNVKNPASETARASRMLNAEMRVALTGTPIENRLSELWSLMTFANPGILGTAAAFDARYERPITNHPDGAVAGELRSVVRPFMLRRTKSDVLAELPPKIEIERACVLGLRQKRLYDALAVAVREAMAKNLEKRKDARTQLSALTAILRLRQMACDPRLVEPTALATDSAKRIAFLDIVRELIAEDRRALVFSQFVELLSLWKADLDEAKVAYEYLDGSTVHRDAVVDRFQNGTAPLFLISLKAGGAGLNLTAADTVIHCDPWWNPAVEDQATDRAHRIGQKRSVTVLRLVAQGTIEDKIALLKKSKKELAAAIIEGGELDLGVGVEGLSEDDLQMLLGDVSAEPDSDVDGDIDDPGP